MDKNAVKRKALRGLADGLGTDRGGPKAVLPPHCTFWCSILGSWLSPPLGLCYSTPAKSHRQRARRIALHSDGRIASSSLMSGRSADDMAKVTHRAVEDRVMDGNQVKGRAQVVPSGRSGVVSREGMESAPIPSQSV